MLKARLAIRGRSVALVGLEAWLLVSRAAPTVYYCKGLLAGFAFLGLKGTIRVCTIAG